MSDATKGLGTILYYASGTNTTAVGNVKSITGPDISVDVLDYTTMDATNNWREKTSGLKDQGALTFDVNYDGSAGGNANALHGLIGNTSYTWGIIFNDHTSGGTNCSKFTSAGFLSRLGFAIPFDDMVTQPIEVVLSGEPTYTDKPA
jgi:predicted secreted protein